MATTRAQGVPSGAPTASSSMGWFLWRTKTISQHSPISLVRFVLQNMFNAPPKTVQRSLGRGEVDETKGVFGYQWRCRLWKNRWVVVGETKLFGCKNNNVMIISKGSMNPQKNISFQQQIKCFGQWQSRFWAVKITAEMAIAKLLAGQAVVLPGQW